MIKVFEAGPKLVGVFSLNKHQFCHSLVPRPSRVFNVHEVDGQLCDTRSPVQASVAMCLKTCEYGRQVYQENRALLFQESLRSHVQNETAL